MKWDATATRSQIIGAIWNGSAEWLKKWLTSNKVAKWFTVKMEVIYSLTRKNIEALRQSSYLNQSGQINLNQLISVLNGDYSVLKKRFYCRKKWLEMASNEIIEDFSKFMASGEFNKKLIASKQIIQKTANINNLNTEFVIFGLKKRLNYPENEIDITLFQRFGLNPNNPNFVESFNRYIKTEMVAIEKLRNFLNPKTETKTDIDYADFITDMVISMNDGRFVNLNSITATMFYSMYKRIKKQQQSLKNQKR